MTLSNLIFIAPKIANQRWIGQLYKAADIVIEIKAGKSYWRATQHESLFIGLFFPFLPYSPWQVRNTPYVCNVGR